MTLQRRREKSPLAIESIDDRYCRSPRAVMLEQGMTPEQWADLVCTHIGQ
jgi:hypothetical protein